MSLWKFGHFKVKQYIWKTVWAKSLKLGQLIGDDEQFIRLDFEKKKVTYFFLC